MTFDVAIAGGDPNGLMLAAELSLAGVRPVVLERLAARSEEPKANGLVGQAVRLLDHRGLATRLSGAPRARVSRRCARCSASSCATATPSSVSPTSWPARTSATTVSPARIR
ncbi:MAG: FAD-dependent monooxygenase [Actinoallomurus sp.]